MDFKIEIACQACECRFELRPTDFKDRASLECPNCGRAFPRAVYEDLKAGILSLGKVSESVCEDPDNPYSEELFMVRVRAYGTLHSLYDQN